MAKLANAFGRATEEWIGKHADSVPPPRVALRVLERYGRKCYLSQQSITERHKYGADWQLEHIKPVEGGGENRESNLAPALTAPHRAKTAAEAKVRAKRNTGLKKRFGIKKVKRVIPGSKASGVKFHVDGARTCRRTGRVLVQPRGART